MLGTQISTMTPKAFASIVYNRSKNLPRFVLHKSKLSDDINFQLYRSKKEFIYLDKYILKGVLFSFTLYRFYPLNTW